MSTLYGEKVLFVIPLLKQVLDMGLQGK